MTLVASNGRQSDLQHKENRLALPAKRSSNAAAVVISKTVIGAPAFAASARSKASVSRSSLTSVPAGAPAHEC